MPLPTGMQRKVKKRNRVERLAAWPPQTRSIALQKKHNYPKTTPSLLNYFTVFTSTIYIHLYKIIPPSSPANGGCLPAADGQKSRGAWGRGGFFSQCLVPPHHRSLFPPHNPAPSPGIATKRGAATKYIINISNGKQAYEKSYAKHLLLQPAHNSIATAAPIISMCAVINKKMMAMEEQSQQQEDEKKKHKFDRKHMENHNQSYTQQDRERCEKQKLAYVCDRK